MFGLHLNMSLLISIFEIPPYLSVYDRRLGLNADLLKD